MIDDTLRAVKKENKRLKDILPKNFARPELDKRRPGDVVDMFANIKMVDAGSSREILGGTYEYCLFKFAEQAGKPAGEFYTSTCVLRTLVEALQPFNGRVYDSCRDRETCLYSRLVSSKTIAATCVTFPYSDRTPIRPHGRWRR